MKQTDLKYNSSYISLNLIDELDFVIGGYGKPNSIFIYSLNAFLEAFILNSTFYISLQELKHLQIVSETIFPNGRPIMEMLSKTKSLNAIGGIGNEIGQVVSIGKFDPQNPTSYQERIEEFINSGLDKKTTLEKYLRIPTLENAEGNLKYLNIGKVEDGYVALESSNSPKNFYDKLCEKTKNTNIQATLPFHSYQYQISDYQSRGLGKEIITNLTTSFNDKQNEINQYFGNMYQTVPPLVTILLSQCNNIDEIPNKMLQLRLDFTKLRESIIKYEKRIKEASTIKEQIQAIDELNEFWSILTKKYSENKRMLYHFWEVAEESGYENSVDNAIDSGDMSEMVDDLNVGKVAGKGAKKVYNWYKEKKILNRFRGVTDMWNLFQESPNISKHISLIEQLFDTKFDLNEMSKINKRIVQIKKNKNDQ